VAMALPFLAIDSFLLFVFQLNHHLHILNCLTVLIHVHILDHMRYEIIQ